ncbi:MAG: hypothetical protein H7Z40_10655 [Phycisphaerae bacterium]|nr:hypothetical protein [Gemmatimonadaceae bacterium]
MVSRESGAPASGALVHAPAFAGTCPASDARSVDDGGAVALTDAEGRFRVVVRTFQSVPIACIRVHYFTDSTRATVPVASVDYAGRRIAQNGIGAPVDSLMVTRRWP